MSGSDAEALITALVERQAPGEAVARCCSAILPCSWQRHNGMGSVCLACQAASGVPSTKAAAPSPAPVAVKALEWNRTNSDRSIHIATALPGEYWAWELAGFGYWSWGSLSGREVFGGIEAAKAAAQADYGSRIRSALVDPASTSAAEDAARICDQIAAAYLENGDATNAMMAQAAAECARVIRALAGEGPVLQTDAERDPLYVAMLADHIIREPTEGHPR